MRLSSSTTVRRRVPLGILGGSAMVAALMLGGCSDDSTDSNDTTTTVEPAKTVPGPTSTTLPPSSLPTTMPQNTPSSGVPGGEIRPSTGGGGEVETPPVTTGMPTDR